MKQREKENLFTSFILGILVGSIFTWAVMAVKLISARGGY
jgi:hypothetical protein